MKLLQQHRIGKLNAEDMEKLKEEEKTSGGGGSALPYILAVVALAAALAYQFVYLPTTVAK